MIHKHPCSAAFAFAALWFSADASASDIEVIYTEITTHSSGTVPGALDGAGSPVLTNWLALEDLAVRHDGGQWCVKGRTTQAATNDAILVLGSAFTGTMFCQDGQPFQGGVAGEQYDFFDSGPPVSWDAAGNIGFSARAKGGSASIFEKVVRFDGTTHTILHKMGDSFPGLTDLLPNPSGDELFGNSIGSVTLLDNGTLLFGNTPITNCHSSRYPAVFKGASAFKQSGISTITVLTAVNEVWDNLLYDQGGGTPDGNHYYWEGDTENANTAIDAIFVVDDVCQFQEGQPIPGAPSLTYADTFQARMLSNGDWFARGDVSAPVNDDDWAVRNGALLAKTGDAITTGSLENWGASFLAVTGNSLGDWILCGNTTEPNVNKDTVMVFNGEQVLVREDDPIDLDGNGLFDDDVFLASIQPNDVYLDDSMVVFFLATLRNGAGTGLGDAFLRIEICGPVTSYGTGCAGSGGFVPTLSLTGCPRPGGTVTLGVANGLGGAGGLLFFGFAQASIPMQNGCTLLVTPVFPSPLAFPLSGAGAGGGTFSIPANLPLGTSGLIIDMQAFVIDGGTFQGYSNSNGVEFEIE